ncbi:MAG: LysM peptidoglycan-binding domain-containing protein [Anaerolineae bacterium]
MRRKPLGIALIGLIIVMLLLVGCRRSAVPPVEELTPEEEATTAMEEAQESPAEEGQPESPIATEVPAPTEEATVEPTEEAEPTAEPTPEPTTETPTEEATEVITEEPTPVPTTVSGGPTTYVVQPGDNLFRIALRHNTSVSEVAQANNITNPSLIYVGQTLTIPAGGETPPSTPPPTEGCSTIHVVQAGENLFRIGLRYNYSQYYLAQVNGISNPSMVYVGQEICIP